MNEIRPTPTSIESGSTRSRSSRFSLAGLRRDPAAHIGRQGSRRCGSSCASPTVPRPPPSSRNGIFGSPGNIASATSTPLASSSGWRDAENLFLELDAEAVFGTGAGDDHAARNRNHQRRNHGHQTVADRQHGIGLERLHDVDAVLQHADQQSGDDVDRR